MSGQVLRAVTGAATLRDACETYLDGRTGHYGWRRQRYAAVADTLRPLGLDDGSTIVDVGAGWTELDYCLRVEHGWRGRYYPVDGGLDDTELEHWRPPAHDYYVLCEILEHLHTADELLQALIGGAARRGIVGTVPDPATTDVLGMDPTHVRADITHDRLKTLGFQTASRSFYGGPADGILFWRDQRQRLPR